jgi:hypothetical protein
VAPLQVLPPAQVLVVLLRLQVQVQVLPLRVAPLQVLPLRVPPRQVPSLRVAPLQVLPLAQVLLPVRVPLRPAPVRCSHACRVPPQAGARSRA